jgi:hypothetical protein
MDVICCPMVSLEEQPTRVPPEVITEPVDCVSSEDETQAKP